MLDELLREGDELLRLLPLLYEPLLLLPEVVDEGRFVDELCGRTYSELERDGRVLLGEV